MEDLMELVLGNSEGVMEGIGGLLAQRGEFGGMAQSATDALCCPFSRALSPARPLSCPPIYVAQVQRWHTGFQAHEQRRAGLPPVGRQRQARHDQRSFLM